MTRTAAREIALRLCFGVALNGQTPEEALEIFFDRDYYASLAEEDELYKVYPDETQEEYIRTVVMGTLEHREELDELIGKYARGWKLNRISKTAAAVLRIAMFEVLYMEDVPDSAAINEAVELAKGYEEKETVSFINGVLGSFVRELRPGLSEADGSGGN